METLEIQKRGCRLGERNKNNLQAVNNMASWFGHYDIQYKQ